MRDAATLRQSIIEHLEVLSSEERQLGYQRDVPWVNITVELVVLWFDDVYHANDPLLAECFEPAQLDALSRFHHYYDERADSLLDPGGSIHDWLRSPVWRAVMDEARHTLDTIKNGGPSLTGSPKS